MKSNVELAKKLGYLKTERGTILKKVADANALPDKNVTIYAPARREKKVPA